jgi:hypothetical protein
MVYHLRIEECRGLDQHKSLANLEQYKNVIKYKCYKKSFKSICLIITH